MNSRKYGRTYHFPFSPGTTSDDRIAHDYAQHVSKWRTIVHTEKLDGENNCLNRYGVFARSHAAPTVSPWTKAIRERWALLKNDLGDLEIFGENLYAIHSIEYLNIDQHFHVFAIREGDRWLSWEEVKFYATAFEFPVVPEIKITKSAEVELIKADVLQFASEESEFESVDIATGKACSREGIVSRSGDEFHVDTFAANVFKYVRKGHVKTDEHWTRHWRRAKLNWERA
ncbi:RNA ligase family protein [Pseudochryseolinea flava]|uniref:2'-5' RNA ligase n=1 Tax=Pseudochryseolinea flava TaxID=2059302 RepID=A0A364Y9R9_9BACT|nr:RNA ligase family protein [Pseudochryseolinea flava]RAW02952.1 2'-5' RNA ligase [Pseudochryseolinea flava]